MAFVHLHTHSHYSLLEAIPKIDSLFKKAKALGMPALALTDHGNLYGAVEFYKAGTDKGIKPIIGCEIYVAEGSHTHKEPGPDNRTFNLVLLAENEEGYKNLIKLITIAQLEGFYHRPRVDKELLKKYKNGLIALSGDIRGEVAQTLWNGQTKEAEKKAKEYRDIFGSQNFYLELVHRPNLERSGELEKGLIALSQKTNIPLVVGQSSYYLDPEDKEAHQTLLRIQHNHETETRFLETNDDLSFWSEEKVREVFGHVPEAIDETVRIAERCTVSLGSKTWIFPDLKIPEGTTYESELRRFAYAGIADRGLEKTPEVVDRIEYELKIIEDKGFAPYFLVVADLLYFARRNGILTTVRGSVAGSMITYLTKITNVNFLEYKLPFERFLNPERPSAPDIDMDYADNRREEVIAYAKGKYGADKVAQIGTFGTMMARGVVRDVARALGYPYGAGDRIAKLIPFGSQGFPMTIENALKLSPELAESYENDRETKEIINLSKKLEGCARHASVHAAGVVMAPLPLTEYTPLQREPKGDSVITQFDMYSIEDVGLLKFDFLGIRNLSILEDAVHLVREKRGITVDIENVPLEDKKTFAMLARGETIGLFQLNGSGMTRYLKDLRPTTIHDINAMVALYRPGPMELIPEYIKRKQNPTLITFLDPRMKDILTASYGVITYQDDVMLIAIHLAGYSWLEADKLRKAMGKKIPAEMQAQKEKFITGAIENGMTDEKAHELWMLIEPFAAYGFNKAHAASYGRVAYQTAYMKANFPAEYMTAVLTAESGDLEEVSSIIAECRRMHIPVLPPDINESFTQFTVIKGETEKDDTIRFGLETIKNFGAETAKALIAEREARGPFANFTDFIERTVGLNLNRRALEALIKSGAMDNLGERGQMLLNIDDALAYTREQAKNTLGQDSFFGLITDDSVPKLTLKESPPATEKERLAWEKELLGLYVSGHPLDAHKERFADRGGIKELKDYQEGSRAIFGGLIEEIRTVITKKGERMAFVKIVDFESSIEAVLFPRSYEELKAVVVLEACVAVQGKVSKRNGETSVLVDKMKLL
jgi:DNA polymerase-3 subunit alpha